MRKRLRIVFAILFVAVLGLLVRQMLQPHKPSDPVYQGRPLRVWLRGFTDDKIMNSDQDRDKIYEAVRLIGTNAIPTLLQMLRARDSALKLKLIALARKQRFVQFQHTPSAAELNVEAGLGFQALRANGKDAVPSLIQIYEQNPFPTVQHAIVMALGSIGPGARKAIPLLITATTNSDSALRNNAVFALGQIHAEPDAVVPVLINCLHDPYGGVRLNAADALGTFGPAAKSALPELVRLLNDDSHIGPQSSVGTSVKNAIQQINSEPAVRAGRNN